MPDPLGAKVLPPVAPPFYVHRPRLDDALREALRRRVTCVVGDAGFGKSTLLGALAARANCAWYSLTPDDAAMPSVSRGIARALSGRVHGFPPDIAAAAGAGSSADGAAEPGRVQALAGLLCAGVRAQLTDLVLVLDDLHELPAGGASAALVEAICRQAPSTLHLVLASRSDPPFAIDRLRRQNDVLEIGGADLAFTGAEVEALLRETLGETSIELASTLYELTDGWPAAVAMTVDALGDATPDQRPDVLRRLSAGSQPLFDRLVEEVVRAEPVGVRTIVSVVSHLERFTPELCSALDLERATEGLRTLHRRGVVVEHRPAGTWYSVNAVVAEFARAHMPLPEGERRSILATAGRWYEEHGDISLALRCALSATDDGRVASLIAEHGQELLGVGDAESILAATQESPSVTSDARVARVVGDARMLRGDWDGALAAFALAGAGAGAGATPIDSALAWRVGSIHSSRGEIDRAVEVYERASRSGEDAKEDAMLFAWRAHAGFLRGDVDACLAHAERSLERAHAAGDDLALAAAYTASGFSAVLCRDPEAETEHWRRALEHAEKAGDVQWIVRIRNQRATRKVFEDAYDDALADLDVVLELSEAAGLTYTSALALTTRAIVRLMRGALDEAQIDVRDAVARFERLGSPVAAYPLRVMGDLHRARGNLVSACAAYERAIEVAKASGNVHTLAMAQAGLAQAIVEERPTEASAHLEEAVANEAAATSPYVQEAAARVALATGDVESARHRAEAVAVTAQRGNDRATLAQALEFQAAAAIDPVERRTLLREAMDIWGAIRSPLGEARAALGLARATGGDEGSELAERAESTFREIGARGLAAEAAGYLAQLDLEARPSISIKTLGAFSIERQGVPVAHAEWQSRKARDLLKMLVARRGKPTPRESLIDGLWAYDPDKAANRFSVALSTVRSVLDPQKRFPPDHFVVADQSSVALSAAELSVDVERFLTNASRGLELRREGRADQAAPYLIEAETLYAGDFLEEDLYEDWTVALREEARAAYVAVARALAEIASVNSDEDAVVRYQLRILERDPYDEHAHLELVASLQRRGQHGEARRCYRAYSARMNEIGVESASFPAP